MLYISRMMNNKYGVIDTDDWTEEFYTKEELRGIHKLGIKIKGITDTGVRIVNWEQEPEFVKARILGYKLEIMASSNSVICYNKVEGRKDKPNFCINLSDLNKHSSYKFCCDFGIDDFITMEGKYHGESLNVPCFVGRIDIDWGSYKKVTLSGGSGLVTLEECFMDSMIEEIVAENLNVSSVKTMESMFSGCNNLHSLIGLNNWNVSNVEDMSYMFDDCYSLRDITSLFNWNTSNVKDMTSMFNECHNLQNINSLLNWNVNKVEDMRYMFSFTNWDSIVIKSGNKLVINKE